MKLSTLFTTTALAAALAVSGMAQADPGMGGKHHRMGKHHERFQEALKELPDDKAKLVEEHFAKTREAHKAERQKLRGLYKELRELATAPQFDKTAYLTKSSEIDTLRSTLRKQRDESFATVASELTQKERESLVKIFRGHRPPPGGPKGDLPPPPPDDDMPSENE